MTSFKDLLQTADWKQEKHVPVIEVPDKIKKGDIFRVSLSIGKEVSHPNTTEHHIRWIDLYFQPQGSKFPYQIGRIEFSAHGESAEGPDTSSVYTHHQVVFSFKTGLPGTIYAASYCNIHGLWENTLEIELVE